MSTAATTAAATTATTAAATTATTTAVPSPPAPADDLDDSRRGSRPPRATGAVEKPPHQAPQAAPPLRHSLSLASSPLPPSSSAALVPPTVGERWTRPPGASAWHNMSDEELL
uniref:Uncharacterized protein n=1 Tax=Oryza meridionalis TaxID=40149 RepID=A0A0E0F2J0_9ORYZ